MNLRSMFRKRRDQLNAWEIRRVLEGVHAVQARTLRQIRAGINQEVLHYEAPGWKEFRLGLIDRVWALRLWIELNVQLMR